MPYYGPKQDEEEQQEANDVHAPKVPSSSSGFFSSGWLRWLSWIHIMVGCKSGLLDNVPTRSLSLSAGSPVLDNHRQRSPAMPLRTQQPPGLQGHSLSLTAPDSQSHAQTSTKTQKERKP
ncbi:hypothetical protein CKAH01_09771 [Colletotrichum kahawae]|uniref:Uncharacterized protein n=1 Tax=Colletotrichum kahawae TaxID=34407 RepID=A0AAD9XZ81_COLKA|nr:hypothetical protein CKAH01_09771 [Colletotrichum kahawae]